MRNLNWNNAITNLIFLCHFYSLTARVIHVLIFVCLFVLFVFDFVYKIIISFNFKKPLINKYIHIYDINISANTRLSIKDFFTTRLSKFVGVSKNIKIQKKTSTIEHKTFCELLLCQIIHICQIILNYITNIYLRYNEKDSVFFLFFFARPLIYIRKNLLWTLLDKKQNGILWFLNCLQRTPHWRAWLCKRLGYRYINWIISMIIWK